MKIEIDTHLGLIIEDPEIIVVKTIDDPINKTFTPCLHLIFGESVIYHEMPPQGYVNNTWTDNTVNTAVQSYFNSINQE